MFVGDPLDILDNLLSGVEVELNLRDFPGVGEVGEVAVKTLHQRVSGAKMLLSPKKDPQQLFHMCASSLATQQCDPLGQNRTRVVN